jgi:hypothetical protein
MAEFHTVRRVGESPVRSMIFVEDILIPLYVCLRLRNALFDAGRWPVVDRRAVTRSI